MSPSRVCLSGFGDCVQWLARADAAGAQAALLDRMPSIGETHALVVRKPFHAEAGQPFWCLYLPALSFMNGWSEHPDEIVKSALVRCDLQDQADGVHVHVTVIDVLPLNRISARFPLGDAIGADYWRDFPMQAVEIARCGDFTAVSGSFEGDITGFALFEKKAVREHLILEGYADFNSDRASACNNPLDDEAAKTLQQLLVP